MKIHKSFQSMQVQMFPVSVSSSAPCYFVPCRGTVAGTERLLALRLPRHHTSPVSIILCMVSNINLMKSSPTMIFIPFQHGQLHNWVQDHLTCIWIMQQPKIIAQMHYRFVRISRKHTRQPLHAHSKSPLSGICGVLME